MKQEYNRNLIYRFLYLFIGFYRFVGTVDFTRHIWNIPIPMQNEIGYKQHPALMPKEIAYRLIKMFSFVNDVVLDCFAGSGTTLAVANTLKRQYIGYELYKDYAKIVEYKAKTATSLF